MTEKRKETLLYQALGSISQIESGPGLYDCLHNCVGMTNAEIKEAGYELEEYYQSDTPEQLAAASGQRYITLEELERQAARPWSLSYRTVPKILQAETGYCPLMDWNNRADCVWRMRHFFSSSSEICCANVRRQRICLLMKMALM